MEHTHLIFTLGPLLSRVSLCVIFLFGEPQDQDEVSVLSWSRFVSLHYPCPCHGHLFHFLFLRCRQQERTPENTG